MNRFIAYIQLMRLDKPIGLFLLLWPTLIGLWFAGEGKPQGTIVLIFVLGVIIMRSAGCVINDFADKDFDGHVARTKQRPLAAKRVKPREALWLFSGLIVAAFCLVLKLNTLTLLLSFVAALLAVIYPFMKRYTNFPQVILGAAFGMSVPMAYTALQNQLSLEAIGLFFCMLCWIVAFDTQYAMVDKLDDLKIGIKSTAIAFGRADRFMISLLQIITLVGLTMLGWIKQFNIYYFVGLGLAMGLAVFQQFLLRQREPAACFRAFLNNNLFGASIFLGLFMAYLK